MPRETGLLAPPKNEVWCQQLGQAGRRRVQAFQLGGDTVPTKSGLLNSSNNNRPLHLTP
ncbi:MULTISPECIES: hypothetical protein [unclassified Tychonema]|uniref:hypothetical protein n=1 Tax=unclassified Tychonema TaxID=2642144 RepID=UPI001D14A199|nr:hypothetical protein [Tychonema sp. LEGE 07199]